MPCWSVLWPSCKEDLMENQTVINKTVKSGITFGRALAMVISYTT